MTRDVDVFFGEFLISPIPLELSLNYCSHKCAYCFANLNDPQRAVNVGAVARFLQDLPSRNTLQALLMKAGYPVLISNRVDPFAVSNYRIALPLMETMTGMGIPLAIQTKGGKGIPETLAFLPPSVWYISISMLDDDLRRQLEPGAPAIGVRFDLIAELTARGHSVVLGLNPCVPEWLPGDDTERLLERGIQAGAKAVWIEGLHLNYKQIAVMSHAEQTAIGPVLMERAKLRRRAPVDSAAFFRARDAAAALGVPVFSNGQPTRSDFWDVYRAVYPKTLPTNQDFVNYCYDHDLTGRLIPFETYAAQMLPSLPEGQLPLAHYLGATAHQIWLDRAVPRHMTYRDLLGILWADRRTKQAPVRMPSFAFAAFRSGDDWIQLVDDNELPYLVFRPEGFDNYFVEVEV